MTSMDMQQITNAIAAANANASRAAKAVSALAQGMGQDMKSITAEHRRLIQETAVMKEALEKLQASRSGNPQIQYVENIPGRRVPFDALVDIPIGSGVTSTQQGTITISQEGPFVAVARFVTFLSQHQFQRTDPVTQAVQTFMGRSFGRYRPTSSVWDLNDGYPLTQVSMVSALPGGGVPHVINPGNESPWRSMEGDYRILFVEAGLSYPRSNIEVPSPFWTTEINSPFQLGALDVFERGEVLTFKILPTHANNAPFGNLSGFGVPNANYPFIDSGWDAVEGINDQNLVAAESTDPIVRLPEGILTIGFHGYRIIQPPGGGNY